MTINSLSLVHSVPFTGLDTQTLNIPTTGRYTVEVNVTIPWQTSDAPSNVAATREVQDVTCAADTAGSRNSTWWKFYTAGDVNGYYVWYNINAAGVDPAPAGLTGIEVAGATGATATTLGGATRTAVAASAAGSYVTVSGGTTHCILTNKQPGECTAAGNGTASAGATFSVTTTGTFGSASGLNIKVYNQTTLLLTLSQPTPTQPLLAGSVAFQSTAADVVTVVLASLSDCDQLANAVKGVINIYAGG